MTRRNAFTPAADTACTSERKNHTNENSPNQFVIPRTHWKQLTFQLGWSVDLRISARATGPNGHIEPVCLLNLAWDTDFDLMKEEKEHFHECHECQHVLIVLVRQFKLLTRFDHPFVGPRLQ